VVEILRGETRKRTTGYPAVARARLPFVLSRSPFDINALLSSLASNVDNCELHALARSAPIRNEPLVSLNYLYVNSANHMPISRDAFSFLLASCSRCPLSLSHFPENLFFSSNSSPNRALSFSIHSTLKNSSSFGIFISRLDTNVDLHIESRYLARNRIAKLVRNELACFLGSGNCINCFSE